MAPPNHRPSTAPPKEGEGRPEDWERIVLSNDQRVALRLTVARGALGLELYEAVEIGPLDVVELSLTLPKLRFPLDLSGGVPRFRHRRGELEHVSFRLSFDRLSQFLERRLGERLFELVRPPLTWGRKDVLSIGLVTARAALAFDLFWAPDAGNARFVVANARGVGLRAPALGFALRALDSIMQGVGERRGRMLTIDDAGVVLGRNLMPAVGARVPSASNVRFGALTIDGDDACLELDASFAPPAVAVEAVRALEHAELVVEADQALSTGDLDRARAGYVALLEQAPRHPELVRLIAEIDVCAGGRAEAALGLMIESMRVTSGGMVAAELLARTGDIDASRQAIDEATRDELFAPLAALAWCRQAELETSVALRAAASDRAVARAPGLASVRFARFAARAQRGDVEGAIADAEHLEAMHVGGRARHDVCTRAARVLFDAGYVRDAGKLFERALRYLPDDASATAGLARALMESGRRERAASLLERAITLSERKGRPDEDALIDLAVLLAEDMKDLPQAIARVRQVSSASQRLIEARFLEARWRSRLGDLVGAGLAFGRMREAIELANAPERSAVDWLREAARFCTEAHDELAAERHLAVALRLVPQDPEVALEYRNAAARLAEKLRTESRRI